MEENKTERETSEELKKSLISYIMNLSSEERKELLAMWKQKQQELNTDINPGLYLKVRIFPVQRRV